MPRQRTKSVFENTTRFIEQVNICVGIFGVLTILFIIWAFINLLF